MREHVKSQIKKTLKWIRERNEVKPASLTIIAGDFNSKLKSGEIKKYLLGKTNIEPVKFLSYNDPKLKTSKIGRIDHIFVAPSKELELKLLKEKTLYEGRNFRSYRRYS